MTNHVISVATHPTREALAASGGKDAHALLWDVQRGVALARLPASADPLDLANGTILHATVTVRNRAGLTATARTAMASAGRAWGCVLVAF